MKVKLLFSGFILSSVLVFAAAPDNYRFEQSFNVKAPGTYKFSIPIIAADKTAWHMKGSVLTGPKGSVPFKITLPPKRQDTVYNYYVAQEGTGTVVYAALNAQDYVQGINLDISLGKEKKNIDVSGSLDNINWQLLGSGTLTDKNMSVFIKPVEAKYIKAVIKDTPAASMPVMGCRILFAYMPPEGAKTVTAKFTQSGNIINIKLPYNNLYIYGIKAYTNSSAPFLDASFNGSTEINGLKEISSSLGGTLVKVKKSSVYSMPLQSDMHGFDAASLTLYGTAKNKVTKVEITYITPEITFDASVKGMYKLYGGSNLEEAALPIEFKPAKTIPLNYVGSMKKNPMYKPFSEFTLGEPRECKFKKGDWHHWAPITISEVGPQELLITPDVIKYASLKNIRILKDGVKEIPFAKGPVKTFALTQKPVVSEEVFALNFPYTNATVASIRLTGGGKPFQADMELTVAAAQEYKYKPRVIDFYWDYIPGGEDLLVNMDGLVLRPGQYIKLVVKTDNVPVEIADAEFVYTLPTILFNAPDAEGYELVFGSKSASKTVYDIQGFEEFLTSTDKSTAYIPVLSIDDTPVDITLETEGSSVFMWILYAVLVMLLIVTVGKFSKRTIKRRTVKKRVKKEKEPKI